MASHVENIGAAALQATPERLLPAGGSDQQIPVKQSGGGVAWQYPGVGGIKTATGTAVTINYAYVGTQNPALLVQCTSSSAVTATLANDVPIGRVVSLRQAGTGVVSAAAGAGATLEKPASASHSTAERYDRIVYQVVVNPDGISAVWGLI